MNDIFVMQIFYKSRKKCLYYHVSLVLNIQITNYFMRIEHYSRRRSIEHGVLFGKVIVLLAHSIRSQKQYTLFTKNYRSQSMQPILVCSCNIITMYTIFLTIHPIRKKDNHICFTFDYMICQFELISSNEILGIYIHTDSKGTRQGFVLHCFEIETYKFIALFCPQFIIEVQMLFTIVCDHVALSIDYSCRVIQIVLIRLILNCFDIAKSNVCLQSDGNRSCKFKIYSRILFDRVGQCICCICKIISHEGHLREENNIETIIFVVLLQRNSYPLNSCDLILIGR